jgi:hypothetical protein
VELNTHTRLLILFRFYPLFMSNNSVRTRTVEFFIDSFEILHLKLLPEVLIDEYDVYDNLLVIRNLTRGKPVLKLLDGRAEDWQMTKKGKEATKKIFESESTIARAILVNSNATKNLMNLFARFSPKEIPQKYFSKEEEAIEWLRAVKK